MTKVESAVRIQRDDEESAGVKWEIARFGSVKEAAQWCDTVAQEAAPRK